MRARIPPSCSVRPNNGWRRWPHGGDKNQEIAHKLSITVSTVEQHLTRVYRKLQVQRRADLPDALETLAVENGVGPVSSL
ncbi:helix-turn-helix transcriptional regulator [Streptomyces sp. NPDC058171]